MATKTEQPSDPKPVSATPAPQPNAVPSSPAEAPAKISAEGNPSKTSPPAAGGMSPQERVAKDQERIAKAVSQKVHQAAQGSLMTIPQRGADGWTACRESPVQLAQTLDNSIRKLNGVGAAITYAVDGPGGSGEASGSLGFASPKFHLECPILTGGKKPDLNRQMINSNGKKFAIFAGKDGWSKSLPLSEISLPSDSQLIDTWFSTFSKLLFLSAGTKLSPVTHLVKAAGIPGSGWIVRADEKQETNAGRTFTAERLVIERGPKLASAKGPQSIELQIDRQHQLPLSVRINTQAPNAKPTKILWAAQWDLHVPVFNRDAFEIPNTL